MSAGSSGAGTGVVFGIALALLGQELGYVDLGPLFPALEALVVFAIVFGVVFGLLGAGIGRRYRRRELGRRAAREVAKANATEPTTATDVPPKA